MNSETPSFAELEAEVHDLRARVRRLAETNELLQGICEGETGAEALLAREREIDLLKAVGEAIVSELDLDRVLSLVAEKARELIQADTLVIPMIEPERDAYVYAAAVGEHAEEIVGVRYKIHVGMCGWVLSHARPLLFGQPREWWMPDKTPWEEGMRSALLVPLFGKGAIIGGLAGLGKRGGGSFQERDLSLLTLFATQVSTAIENARLFGELQQLVNELEKRVDQRTAELQAANQELECFSYSVSHDLRAPLISIQGFGTILLEEHAGQLDEEGCDCLRRITAASQRMSDLIDGLLKLARATRGTLEIRRCDFSGLARRVAEQIQAQDPGRAVTWALRDGLSVRGDERLLESLLQNLLGNAWKYTAGHAAARIELGCLPQAEQSDVFFVRDDGAGFDMAQASRLFRAFQRLHPEGHFPGSGIGLATVQRIIHRHGGRIWAEAAVERGATFYFTLPRGERERDDALSDRRPVCDVGAARGGR